MDDLMVFIGGLGLGALFTGLIVFSAWDEKISGWPEQGFTIIDGTIYRLEAVDLNNQ